MRSSIASGLLGAWLALAASAAAQSVADPVRPPTAVERARRPIAEANALLQAKRHDEALRVLDDALRASPRDPQLRFLYGLVLADKGDTAQAIDVFQQLTQDFPELPEPYNNLAVLLAGRGDLDQARVALENAVRALPSYAIARDNLGDVYLRMAMRSWEQAQQLAPSAALGRKLDMARQLLSNLR